MQMWQHCYEGMHWPLHTIGSTDIFGTEVTDRQSMWWISSLCPCLFANSKVHCLSIRFSWALWSQPLATLVCDYYSWHKVLTASSLVYFHGPCLSHYMSWQTI